MLIYIYSGGLYCKDCGDAIRKRITSKGLAPEDPNNECSYESDDFPKGSFPSEIADMPLHCDAVDNCLNAIHFGVEGYGGFKIGAWLENELTTDGIEYVLEAIQNYKDGFTPICGYTAVLWADLYSNDLKAEVQE